MSSVLDAIRRVLGRDRDQRPDAGASSEAAPSTQTGAAEAEPALLSTTGQPAPATPGDEAELPIQPTAPPMPSMTASPAETDLPAETTTVPGSAEVERADETTSPQPVAASEPLGNGSEPERSVADAGAGAGADADAGVGVEETVQHSIGDESSAAAAGHVSAISEETGSAIVAEEALANQEEQGQAIADEPLALLEVPQDPQDPPFAESLSLESGAPTQTTRPEESPEKHTVEESLESPASPAPDESR